MGKKTTFTKYVIIIYPLIFLWAGLNFDRNNYPNDPEYIYLINSLCICDGQSVGHIDNPGTTLMQIGAVTMKFMHLFSNPNNEPIVEQVLKEPNKFIESTRKTIVILNTLLLFLLGWLTFKKTRSVWVAIFLQTGTFLSAYILEVTWANLSPESLLFLTTGIYVILVLYYYLKKEKTKWNYVIYFALITGAGLATKATFLPLIILPLFVIPTVRKKLTYLLLIVPSFVLFTIPAIPEYNRMFFWFRDLLTHSGIYGHGEKGIINMSTYFPNIKNILINNPGIPIILITGTLILAVGYFFSKKQNIKWDLKFLAGLLCTFLFGTLLVAKHYGGNHYLIPELLLLGITLYIIINIIKQIFESKTLNSILLPGLAIMLIGFIAWNHPKKLIVPNLEYKAASAEIDTTNTWVEKNYKEYTPINYYIYSINKFTGLKFGDSFAKGKMLSYLKKLYPKTYFYELSSNTYLNWNLKTNLNDIVETNGKKILLMNAPGDPAQIEEIEKLGFPLKQVYKGNAQNIYILDTLIYTQPEKENLIQIGRTINFDTETYSEDGKYFLGSNAEVFGPVNALSTEQARSGIHSIKLAKQNPYAIDYELKNTKAGDLYQIEVWRKSKRSNGYLVLAVEKTNEYYQAQNEAIKLGENGWELLRIELEITKELENKKLKVYLWNPQNRAAYFDDLSIKKFSKESSEEINQNDL